MINPQTPLVESKRSLIIMLILLVLIIVLSIPYPGPDPLIDILLRTLGIPLHSHPETETGLHYSGILISIMLIVALVHFSRAFSRHRLVLFFVFLMLVSTVPGWVITGYQRYFASGVYALELDPQQVSCSYEWKDGQLGGNCQIPIDNHSKEELQVRAVLRLPVDASSHYTAQFDPAAPLTQFPLCRI